jgi:DNA modification methylase
MAGTTIRLGSRSPRSRRNAVQDDNKLRPEDRAVHEWYRFVLSFPPHLVRDYLERLGLGAGANVLDPFCGAGTTLVECKKLGIESTGVEANPMACFASEVKVDWRVDPDALLAHAHHVADLVRTKLRADAVDDFQGLPLFARAERDACTLQTLSPTRRKLLLRNSISPLPLHKTLRLLEALDEARDDRFYSHQRLAVAKVAVFEASNLHFGPEVGLGRPKFDAPVLDAWLKAMGAMAQDLRAVRGHSDVPASVRRADSRVIGSVLEPNSVDGVFTSPPYPNEKDYTRTTRLESVLLGYIRTKQDLRGLKERLVRSNTRNVYKSDQDHLLIAQHKEIQRVADAIEARRIELGKTSGWERLYARVTRLYFGGMARHLAELRTVLKPGARLAYVVGDQASYFRVMIRTGQLLADVAESLGYSVEGIDLFRTRIATATREQLREEVILLRWAGTTVRTSS